MEIAKLEYLKVLLVISFLLLVSVMYGIITLFDAKDNPKRRLYERIWVGVLIFVIINFIVVVILL